MDKKLTLSLNAHIVEKAKSYAKENGISLSRMIENYLALLTDADANKSTELTISPLVNRLVGVVDLEGSEEEAYKSDYTDYLMEKYK